MRKLLITLIIFICVISFCGCGEKEKLSVTKQEKELYSAKIKDILKKEHWNYDDNGISFERENVPDDNSENFEKIRNASLSYGADIDKYKGEQAVCASVKLFHFNNEEAGKAEFYFVDDSMACGYYYSGKDIHAFSEINVFLNDGFDKKTENNDITQDFDKPDIKNLIDGFDAGFFEKGGSFLGVISEEKLKIFKFNQKGFYIDKEFDFSDKKLFPMDVSFNDDGKIAVLLGKKKKTEHEIIYSEEQLEEMRSNGRTDVEINGAEILVSDSIAFFDKNYNSIYSPCKLEVSSYGAIDFSDGRLFAARGKGVDIFTEKNGVFSKTKQYLLNQWVQKIKSADIDGDGEKEFVTTDNTNLFLYHFKDSPVLLWKTHLSIESMDTRFYIEDLNGDGVKEIYVSDAYLKTSAKYILTSYGFKALSAEYEKEYIPGDFNGDGKTDYIAIGNEERENILFLGK